MQLLQKLFLSVFAFSIYVSTEDIDLSKRADGTCWMRRVSRGVGKPISSCEDGLEKSGLICYPPCPANYTGIGPVCWKGIHGKGRGVGVPLGCRNGTQYVGGLCYPPCPPYFYPEGPMCVEQCPEDRPYRCGMLCTVDKHMCTEEIMTSSIAGFGILYGLGTFGAAVAAIVGTNGAATVVAAFLMVSGLGEFTTGSLTLAAQLVSYPFCRSEGDKGEIIRVFEDAKESYSSDLLNTCNAVIKYQTKQEAPSEQPRTNYSNIFLY